MRTRRELVEEIWRASNLTWRQAERIIDEAVDLGLCGDGRLAS